MLGAAACNAAEPRSSRDDSPPATDPGATPTAGSAGDPTGGTGDGTPPTDDGVRLRVTFDGADHGSDQCFAVAVASDGTIVETGEVARIAQGHNAFVRSYDPSGGLRWSYELSTPSEGQDRGSGVVALPDGGALAAGEWYSGSDTRLNSFWLQFDASGQLTDRAVSEMVGDDQYNALARNASGRLVFAGNRPDATGTTQSYVSSSGPGGASWSVLRDGTAAGRDAANAVAVDEAGGVVVGGSELDTGAGTDGWLSSYTPDGALRWSIALVGPGNAFDAVDHVAVGPDGTIALTGTFDSASTFRVLDADGTPRWDITADAGAVWSGVAFDAAGDVVVTGSAGSDLVARKYAPDGTLIWERHIASAYGAAVTVGPSGEVVICGAAMIHGNKDALVAVLAP